MRVTESPPGGERAPGPAAPTPAHTARRLGWHVPRVTGSERLLYTVRLDSALERIAVELCPSGFRIERLNAPSPGAARWLEGGNIITPEGDVPCAGDSEGVDLPASASDECLSYAVALPRSTSDPTNLRRVGRDSLGLARSLAVGAHATPEGRTDPRAPAVARGRERGLALAQRLGNGV